MADDRLKHLEFIQGVITRMASNSFLVKGWSVTLVSAVLAVVAAKESNHKFGITLVGFLPVLLFWGLDGFFLRQEKLYRALWDDVRMQPAATPVDFNMNTSKVSYRVDSWGRVCLSKTLLPFHGVLLLVLIAILLFGLGK